MFVTYATKFDKDQSLFLEMNGLPLQFRFKMIIFIRSSW